MKNVAVLLISAFLYSCTSIKYKVGESKYNFNKIEKGSNYTFYDKNDRKLFLRVTSIQKDSIKGIRKTREFAIAKNDIKEIKKNKTTATIVLISSSAVIIGTTWSLLNLLKF